MNLHCIGDSHCSFFLGENRISKEYPQRESGIFKNIYCYRLGSPLAFNLNRFNSKTRAKEKLLHIIESLKPSEDLILLSFGEVDCRAHIFKKSIELGCSTDTLVMQCIQNYLDTVNLIIEKGFKVLVWNPVYSANYDDTYPFEYPYFGDCISRNKVTKYFNEILNDYQNLGYIHLDFSKYLINSKTLMTQNEFYFDEIHLNNKLFLKVIREIKKQIPLFKLKIDFKKIHKLFILITQSI